MGTIDVSNCVCCKVDCPSNTAHLKKRLNAKVTICGVDTVTPSPAVWNGSTDWLWVAGDFAHRYPINGGGASLGDGVNTLDGVDLACIGTWTNAAAIAYYASSGLHNTTGPISYIVLDPGPGTFRIRYYFGETGGLGLTFCTGSVFLELWE